MFANKVKNNTPHPSFHSFSQVAVLCSLTESTNEISGGAQRNLSTHHSRALPDDALRRERRGSSVCELTFPLSEFLTVKSAPKPATLIAELGYAATNPNLTARQCLKRGTSRYKIPTTTRIAHTPHTISTRNPPITHSSPI
jgi:hypothetical protein